MDQYNLFYVNKQNQTWASKKGKVSETIMASSSKYCSITAKLIIISSMQELDLKVQMNNTTQLVINYCSFKTRRSGKLQNRCIICLHKHA